MSQSRINSTEEIIFVSFGPPSSPPIYLLRKHRIKNPQQLVDKNSTTENDSVPAFTW